MSHRVDDLPRIRVSEHRGYDELPGASFRLPKASKTLFGCSSSGCLTLVFLFVLIVLLRLVFHG